MFTAALFTTARLWKQPKCPSTEERIKKMWYIYHIFFFFFSFFSKMSIYFTEALAQRGWGDVVLVIVLGCLLCCSNQGSGAGEGLGNLQELMLQHLFSWTSLLHIHFKTAVQKVLEDSWQVLWVLKLRGPIGGDEVQGSQRTFTEVWGLPFNHFDGHDAQGPTSTLGP